MKQLRQVVLFIVMVALAAGCNLPQPTPEPVPPPAKAMATLPAAEPARKSPCGDGVCTAPENEQNCPQDCIKPANPEPDTSPTPAPVVQAGLPAQPGDLRRPEDLQIGLNFIRFYWSNRTNDLDMTTPYLQPEAIFAEFGQMNIQAYRQFVKADLYWDIVEPRDNEWNFAQADAVIAVPGFEPLVTLFRMQYASPTPPWATTPDEFQKTIGPEAEDYIRTVVERYAPYVRYWEIGNEMAYWRAGDPGSTAVLDEAEEMLPASHPPDGYSPEEQGVFLAQAAALVRQYDPDAVIVMPGMPALDDYSLKTWLPGILKGGGKDWFEIVNYHYYAGWEQFTLQRPRLDQTLEQLGIGGRPVWSTETGATSLDTLTLRTDYPNSPETQAADVFRRIVSAWGLGDQLVVWHTYIDGSDSGGNWAGYGIRSQRNNEKTAWAAFNLLTHELVPYQSVEALEVDARGANVYRVTTKVGSVYHVAWGAGKFNVPDGMTQMTLVVAADGVYTWQVVQPGQEIDLGPVPVLLK